MCGSLVYRQGERLGAKFLEAFFKPKLQGSVVKVCACKSVLSLYKSADTL